MNMNIRTAIFWMVVGLTAILLFTVVRTGPKAAKVSYTQFLRQVQADEVATATIRGGGGQPSPTTLQLRNGATVRTVLPPDYRDALAAMQAKGVSIEFQESSSPAIFLNAVPFLVLLALWFIMLARMKGGQPQGRPV